MASQVTLGKLFETIGRLTVEAAALEEKLLNKAECNCESGCCTKDN